eukprot:1301390-Rhodomonas_salina.2
MQYFKAKPVIRVLTTVPVPQNYACCGGAVCTYLRRRLIVSGLQAAARCVLCRGGEWERHWQPGYACAIAVPVVEGGCAGRLQKKKINQRHCGVFADDDFLGRDVTMNQPIAMHPCNCYEKDADAARPVAMPITAGSSFCQPNFSDVLHDNSQATAPKFEQAAHSARSEGQLHYVCKVYAEQQS